MCISIIGKAPARLRSYFGELFGWESDTSAPVTEAVSEPANYGFVNRITTSDGIGIPRGVGGDASYTSHVVCYVGVPDVEAALQKAESLGGKRQMDPRPGADGPGGRPLHRPRGQPNGSRRDCVAAGVPADWRAFCQTDAQFLTLRPRTRESGASRPPKRRVGCAQNRHSRAA